MSSRGHHVVNGHVACGFEQVRHAFAENFAHRGDLGASFAVSLDGELVVDLWGGVADADRGAPWAQDTLQVIFSGTKGLVGLCLLMLLDRGDLELEAPVARYWPEFAAEGKQDVRVIDLASHQSRLPGFRKPLSEDELVDDRHLASLLASQPLDDDMRAGAVYHPLTYGWLCGEVVRRVDGRSVGRFFAEEVAAPLGLDIWIGLPRELESRVSTLRYADDWGQQPHMDPQRMAEDELLARVWNNPPLFPVDHIPWNRADWHRAEIPGVGGIGTARSLARLYGCLALGGSLDGVSLLSQDALACGRQMVACLAEPLIGLPLALGVGFELQTELCIFGRPADAFGYCGAGGSVHGAWPSHGLGFSYAMNLLRDDAAVDPRAQALLDALHGSVIAGG